MAKKIGIVLAGLLLLAVIAYFLFHEETLDELAMRAHGSFSGTVIDASDSSPIAGAEIVAIDVRNDEKTVLYSEQNGRFKFTLPASRYRFETTKPGYLDAKKRVLTMVSGVSFINAAIAMTKASSLSGRVLAGSSPVAANVRLKCEGSEEVTLRSANDGHFHFDNLRQSRCELKASAPGFSAALISNIDIPHAEHKTIGDIPLSAAVSLQGKIIDTWTGKKLSDVAVTLSDSKGNVTERTLSDGEGYLLYVPKHSVNTISVSKVGYRSRASVYRSEDANGGNLDFELKPVNKILVRLIRGTDAGNAEADVIFKDIASGAEERLYISQDMNEAIFESKENKVYSIDLKPTRASAGRFVGEALTRVATDGDIVTFRINNFGAISVKVEGEDETDENNAKIRIAMLKTGEEEGVTGLNANFDALPEGNYRVSYGRLENGDITWLEHRDLRLDAGATEEVVFRGEGAGKSFAGKIVSKKSREALSGVLVTYNDPDVGDSNDPNGKIYQTFTDSQGNFTIKNLPENHRFSIYVSRNEGEFQIFSGLKSGESGKVFEFDTDAEPSMEGIGAEIYEAMSGIAIGRVRPGSGAQKEGLEEGDIITEIDGKSVPDDIRKASELLRGESGTTVRVRVTRDGRVMDFLITRKSFALY